MSLCPRARRGDTYYINSYHIFPLLSKVFLVAVAGSVDARGPEDGVGDRRLLADALLGGQFAAAVDRFGPRLIVGRDGSIVAGLTIALLASICMLRVPTGSAA